MSTPKRRYPASERKWVRDLLRKLTDTEYAEYERRMKLEPSHPNSGKKYDGQKAEVAGQVLAESRRRGPTAPR